MTEYTNCMEHKIISRQESIAFSIVTYIVLVAAAIVGLKFNAPATDSVRWAVIILLAAVALAQTRTPWQGGPPRTMHTFLAVYGALVAGLMFLQPGWTMYPMLYSAAILCGSLHLPWRACMAWVAAYAIATAASLAAGIAPSEGLIGLFLYGVFYTSAAALGIVLSRTEAARRRSQALLAELQQAHQQLQEYALRSEEMAVMEERNRLAREMHDTLGHRLTVAAVQLEAAQRLCPTDPAKAESLLDTVREQVREALWELRGTVATLRTPIEADLHLLSALRRLTEHFENATGLDVHRILPQELPPLPDAHRLAFYRAAQEALTNVQRHAEASQVWLVLSSAKNAVTLLVADDGKGISAANGQTGFGLQGLRERAKQLRGDLCVEPRAGGGTELSFRLPLPGDDQDA